ncbi:hypothetical protein SteCoe_17471 [Stentor coeruleus]|uniref:RING-type E3 ubiquitin transferase n=1 Tax=Stentor coeruleus TaxID=5963 RepID=A0A1R2BYY8_9CILI|nr:hypothetical protein SteCoe_17471 [Stentor coeruleus]
MNSLHNELKEFGYSDDLALLLCKRVSSIQAAIDLLESRRPIALKIMEFGFPEKVAIEYSLQYATIEDAMEFVFTSFSLPKRRNNNRNHSYQGIESNNQLHIITNRYSNLGDYTSNINQESLFVQDDPNSLTRTIYLAAPGVSIEGKDVINCDRDTAVSYINDEFNKRPLDFNKYILVQQYYVENPDFLQEKCTICLENYNLNEIVGRLPCYHFFHSSCLIEYFKSFDECPIDKEKL